MTQLEGPAVAAVLRYVLIVGSSSPYIEHYHKPGSFRAVQIDRDSARIGLRYPVECGLVGDAAPTLRALLALLRPNQDRRFVEAAQKSMREWRQSLKEQGEQRETPMKPQVVGYELNKLLASDAIVTTDSGTNTSWSARYLGYARGGHDVRRVGKPGDPGMRSALCDVRRRRRFRTGRSSLSLATAGSRC